MKPIKYLVALAAAIGLIGGTIAIAGPLTQNTADDPVRYEILDAAFAGATWQQVVDGYNYVDCTGDDLKAFNGRGVRDAGRLIFIPPECNDAGPPPLGDLVPVGTMHGESAAVAVSLNVPAGTVIGDDFGLIVSQAIPTGGPSPTFGHTYGGDMLSSGVLNAPNNDTELFIGNVTQDMIDNGITVSSDFTSPAVMISTLIVYEDGAGAPLFQSLFSAGGVPIPVVGPACDESDCDIFFGAVYNSTVPLDYAGTAGEVAAFDFTSQYTYPRVLRHYGELSSTSIGPVGPGSTELDTGGGHTTIWTARFQGN